MADPFAVACKQAARQLRRIPNDLRHDVKQHVRTEVAEPLARAVASAASGAMPYGPSAQPVVKARLDFEPVVVIPARPRARTTEGRATVGNVVFGQEFGGGGRVRPVERTKPSGGTVIFRRDVTAQFQTHRPFIYVTLRRNAASALEAWATVLDPFLEEWETR